MSYLTAELPGTGGMFKESPGDFVVEEIPLYPCSGTGEHLYLWIEKSGISTTELITRLAQGLRLKDKDIGYAGLKDSRALTRQWLSVPVGAQVRLSTLKSVGFRILEIARHTNKLRIGHLAGNRFTIVVNHVVADAASRAEAILEKLQCYGVPNLFGEQRYGVLKNSDHLGILLLQQNFEEFCRELIGDPQKISHPGWQKAARAYRQNDLETALQALPGGMRLEQQLLRDLLRKSSHRQAVLKLPKQRLRFFLSAAQSSFFDQLLFDRISAPWQLKPGDIAYIHANGACFRVEDPATEQPRADRFDISPTAPLFGSKVMIAQGEPGAAETALLTQSGLNAERWKLPDGPTMPGERRPLRVPILMPAVTAVTETSLTLVFSLPRGSYATSVLREVTKNPPEMN